MKKRLTACLTARLALVEPRLDFKFKKNGYYLKKITIEARNSG